MGKDGVMVSHLPYADDTIYFGEWDRLNASNLMCIHKAFEEMSGLKINFQKSCVYGVGVEDKDIDDMASFMRCKVGKLPFT